MFTKVLSMTKKKKKEKEFALTWHCFSCLQQEYVPWESCPSLFSAGKNKTFCLQAAPFFALPIKIFMSCYDPRTGMSPSELAGKVPLNVSAGQSQVTSLLHVSGSFGPWRSPPLDMMLAPFPCFWRTTWYLWRSLDCLQKQHPAGITPSPPSFLAHVGTAISNPHEGLAVLEFGLFILHS